MPLSEVQAEGVEAAARDAAEEVQQRAAAEAVLHAEEVAAAVLQVAEVLRREAAALPEARPSEHREAGLSVAASAFHPGQVRRAVRLARAPRVRCRRAQHSMRHMKLTARCWREGRDEALSWQSVGQREFSIAHSNAIEANDFRNRSTGIGRAGLWRTRNRESDLFFDGRSIHGTSFRRYSWQVFATGLRCGSSFRFFVATPLG